MVPTHNALALAADVRQAIKALRKLAALVQTFEPGGARLHFNLGATDYVALVRLPVLMARLAMAAPGITWVVHDDGMSEEMLLSGKMDLALFTVPSASFPLYRQELFHDRDVYVPSWAFRIADCVHHAAVDTAHAGDCFDASSYRFDLHGCRVCGSGIGPYR